MPEGTAPAIKSLAGNQITRLQVFRE